MASLMRSRAALLIKRPSRRVFALRINAQPSVRSSTVRLSRRKKPSRFALVGVGPGMAPVQHADAIASAVLAVVMSCRTHRLGFKSRIVIAAPSDPHVVIAVGGPFRLQ